MQCLFVYIVYIYFTTQINEPIMKINVFRTQCKIGSKVLYKGKVRVIADIDRRTNSISFSGYRWIRCTEAKLLP